MTSSEQDGDSPEQDGDLGERDRNGPGAEAVEDLQDLIAFIAKALVDDPDAVQVTAIEGEKTTVIELTVGEGDLGKVIGKEVRTARALRTLLAATSAKQNKRAVLEILE